MRYCRAARWLVHGREELAAGRPWRESVALVCLREPRHGGWHHDDRMGVWWPP